MCHSLVMNYGLYKKMEIFVRGDPISRVKYTRDVADMTTLP